VRLSSIRLPPTTRLLVPVLASLLVTWAFFHRQLSRSLTLRLLLASTSPREEFFDELAEQSGDPSQLLRLCWDTGKITHRQLVADFLAKHAGANPPWFNRLEDLLVAGSADADLSVRELALAVLDARRSPRLFDCARAQLVDVDPMVRLLGLDYLRKSDPQKAVPVVMRMLDDPDLRIVAGAEVAMMRWSGEDYGVRARLAIPTQEGAHPGEADPANAEAISRGVERRKEWWRIHSREYASPFPAPMIAEPTVPKRFPAPDFLLKDLQGRTVCLSGLRGKVVILNFWATWCTACLAEIPDLIALQDELGNKVAILGVALDGVPDEDGHIPAEDSGEKSDKSRPSSRAVEAKVERAVKARGINYPVLLDPTASAGAQFNGGELPTTVIIDAQSLVRRRFIGERSVGVFKNMIAEAAVRVPY